MIVTATEDSVSTANNTSRVVVTVKLEPAGSQAVYNGYNQTLTVKVNSSTIGTKAFTYSIPAGGSLALGTYTTTITHNADGSKTVPIVVSASGGGDSASISQSLVLTKIARASSITGGWNWTIGNNTTVSISRASSSFTHTVYIDTWNKSTASWGNIRTITGVGTSISSGFVASNIATMAQHLRNEGATAGSIKTRIRIQTYSGSTAIGGVVSKEGTLTNINASTISSATATAHNGVPYTITRQSSNGNITHELSYQFGTFNKKLTLANNASNTGTMSFNSTELDTIYKQVTGGLYGTGGFTLTTYIAGVQVKNTVTVSNLRLNFDTAQVAPTISNAFTFSDTNASMVAITGSNQIAIQNKSIISVVIPANASTFKSGATGKTYSVTINGVEKTATYSASATTIAFGTVSAGSNTTITVSITDSRGIKVSTTKTLVVYPYANPTVSGVMARANGFDDSTTIRATGAIASVSSKNAITSVHYRFKEITASAYGSYVALTPTLTGANFSTNTVTRSFDNTKKYHVEFRIIDKVGTTTTNVVLLDSGKPIMFVDKKNKSVGIGKFPDFANTLETEGDLRVGNRLLVNGELQVAGALAGGLYVSGSASESPLRVRGIEGNDGTATANTTASNLYLNWVGKNAVYTGGNLSVGGAWTRGYGIVSSGSNANGEYMQFDNGLQICWKESFVVSGYVSNVILMSTWTYPSAFKADTGQVNGRTAVFVTKNEYTNTGVLRDTSEGSVSAKSNTTADIYLMIRDAGMISGWTQDVRVLAIGRWK